jgi:membrane protein DedA with SNARE-associated domain/rhodanese-related sulfurtransferase
MSMLSQLSYSGLFLAVFARQLCLPVPAILFLITAGALAAHGQLHVTLVIVAGILGCLAGDFVWFRIGRVWGKQVLGVLYSLSSDPAGASERARAIFRRWGLRMLVIAKFIPGLDGVTPPLAGAEGSPVLSFVMFDSVGGFLWSSAYIGLGFIFANQLALAIAAAERFGVVLGVVIGVPLLLYIGWRAFRLLMMIRRLRVRHMSPALLANGLDAGDRIAVIDLLRFEDGQGDQDGIAGAIRIDPKRLRYSAKIGVPDDLKVVIYCSSRGALVSARVAMAMKRRGVANVWLLEGGLAAWKAEGYATTSTLGTREDLTTRFGIQLPPDPVAHS